MKEEIIQNINQGLEAAYINGNLASNLEYKPSFISNNPEEGKLLFSVDDTFKVLEIDGDATLIEKIGDENNPYFVSGCFLESISDYKHKA